MFVGWKSTSVNMTRTLKGMKKFKGLLQSKWQNTCLVYRFEFKSHWQPFSFPIQKGFTIQYFYLVLFIALSCASKFIVLKKNYFVFSWMFMGSLWHALTCLNYFYSITCRHYTVVGPENSPYEGKWHGIPWNNSSLSLLCTTTFPKYTSQCP